MPEPRHHETPKDPPRVERDGRVVGQPRTPEEMKPEHERDDIRRKDENLGGIDKDTPRNERLTLDNAAVPDSMTPPTKDEAQRQKSYAQMRREHDETDDDRKLEEARLALQPKISGGRLSVPMQPQPVPVHRGVEGIRPTGQPEIEARDGIETHHLEDIVLLPKFTVDDARKLKGGEGQQWRIDAVKMVQAEKARVEQLHAIVGVSDIGLGCDGLIMDPPNDFTALDAAMAAAEAQVETSDTGDSDVKEIAIISMALQETARYWAIEVPEQAPPPEVLTRFDGETEAEYDRRVTEHRRQAAEKKD